ncbi:HEAT repeat domain-containing protein [Streptomyces angustmyceticus]|uniref:HEAT repeat domain-containing protein n=1 Tax=Streptomyces angustmyceticus TaxID=285578 RepID=UPI00344E2D81
MSEDIAALVRQLAAADRDERRAATDRLVALGAPVVEHLLPLLAEEDGPGRSAAEACVQRLGTAAIEPLRRVRSEGPGHLRPAALRMLASVGGGDALSPADRAAVERLVQVKLLDETPGDLPSDAWVAVPRAEVKDILRALELHDARPVTTALGVSAALHHENSLDHRSADGTTSTEYRVFITPEFDGWRLVYGADYLNDNWAQAIEKLSTHCREAHFYEVDEYNGARVWWVMENGQDKRGHRTYGDPEWVGEPLEFERDLMQDAAARASEGEGEEEEEGDALHDSEEAEEYAEGVRDPEEAASSISIQPSTVEVLDRVGHGWLAVTSPEVGHGRFRGALDI